MRRPAASQDVSWSPTAVDIVVTSAAGYPYFLQEFAKATWDYAPGPGIKPADARLGPARKESVQQVGPIRANLIHKGLVYAPEHGQVAYTVPGMAAFIRSPAEARTQPVPGGQSAGKRVGQAGGFPPVGIRDAQVRGG